MGVPHIYRILYRSALHSDFIFVLMLICGLSICMWLSDQVESIVKDSIIRIDTCWLLRRVVTHFEMD
ncbi:hypothetical protein RIF29_27655 [Crotalaria pallida]|uniref:Uncharacterized protein n=1 Tax=Crotalaria pallida TaxID=3830 RepID=A0AAN9ERU5_CROPI